MPGCQGQLDALQLCVKRHPQQKQVSTKEGRHALTLRHTPHHILSISVYSWSAATSKRQLCGVSCTRSAQQKVGLGGMAACQLESSQAEPLTPLHSAPLAAATVEGCAGKGVRGMQPEIPQRCQNAWLQLEACMDAHVESAEASLPLVDD